MDIADVGGRNDKCDDVFVQYGTLQANYPTAWVNKHSINDKDIASTCTIDIIYEHFNL
jgi:hypothetical protein